MYKLKGKSMFEKYSNLESLSQVFFYAQSYTKCSGLYWLKHQLLLYSTVQPKDISKHKS